MMFSSLRRTPESDPAQRRATLRVGALLAGLAIALMTMASACASEEERTQKLVARFNSTPENAYALDQLAREITEETRSSPHRTGLLAQALDPEQPKDLFFLALLIRFSAIGEQRKGVNDVLAKVNVAAAGLADWSGRSNSASQFADQCASTCAKEPCNGVLVEIARDLARGQVRGNLEHWRSENAASRLVPVADALIKDPLRGLAVRIRGPELWSPTYDSRANVPTEIPSRISKALIGHLIDLMGKPFEESPIGLEVDPKDTTDSLTLVIKLSVEAGQQYAGLSGLGEGGAYGLKIKLDFQIDLGDSTLLEVKGVAAETPSQFEYKSFAYGPPRDDQVWDATLPILVESLDAALAK